MTEKTKAKWLGIMDQIERSGLTVSEWSIAHGHDPRKIYFYRWQLRKEGVLMKTSTEPSAHVGNVVGTRQAAKVLNVSVNAVRKRLKKAKLEGKLLNFGVSAAGQRGVEWKSEAHLREWFHASRGSPKQSNQVLNEPLPANDKTWENILSPVMMKEITRIHGQFNKPSNCLLRRMRGENEIVPMEEVINLLLGMGVANWPSE